MTRICSKFPNEVKNIIISMLADDIAARAAASLACFEFRRELYRSIFAEVVITSGNIAGFLAITSSSFSATSIIPRIQNFVLEVSSSWTNEEWTALDHLLRLLAPNNNIHTFTLSCALPGILGECPSTHSQFQMTTFSSVRRLKLCRLAFSKPEELADFLSRFPNVMHIELQSVMCRWETNDSLRVQLPGEFSAQFTMEGSQRHQKILHWDLLEPVSTLKLDEIAAVAGMANSTIPSSLQSLGVSLHHLSVRFHLYDFQAPSQNDILQTFDLSSTPKLRKLSLGSSRHVLSLMPWVPTILYTLSKSESSTLTHLEIVFASSRQIHLDRTFLRYLSVALSEPTFHNLESIHFIGYQDHHLDIAVQKIVKDLIKSVLRRWDEKNMLEFTFRQAICVTPTSTGDGIFHSSLGQPERENMWF